MPLPVPRDLGLGTLRHHPMGSGQCSDDPLDLAVGLPQSGRLSQGPVSTDNSHSTSPSCPSNREGHSSQHP